MLVHLVHRGADEAELDHRAVALDEARVRGSARGRELRRHPGHRRDRARDELGERSRLGQEAHARDLEAGGDADAEGLGGAVGLLLDPAGQRLGRMGVVEADVHRRPRLGRDHVRGRVADIDRGDRQRRRPEVRRARGRARASPAGRAAAPAPAAGSSPAPDRPSAPAPRSSSDRRSASRAGRS